MSEMKELAKEIGQEVNFGWISTLDDELLAETFEARFLPQIFLIKDGTTYWFRDF